MHSTIMAFLSFKTNKQRKRSKMTAEFFKVSKPDFAFALLLVTELIRKLKSQILANKAKLYQEATFFIIIYLPEVNIKAQIGHEVLCRLVLSI